MKQRDNSFDFVRVVAMIFIVTAHFLMFSNAFGLSPLGHFLAGVGNFIFFALSAVLFGIRFQQKGSDVFMFKPFMTKRLIKLFSSLWPFLFLLLGLFLCIGVRFSPFQVILNFAGFGWFAKLPDNGHLWFVTMMIFCYVMYAVVAKFKHINKINGGGYFTIILLICLGLKYVVDSFSLPGYMFLILFYSLFLFLNANKFLNMIKKIKMYLVVFIVILFTTIALLFIEHVQDSEALVNSLLHLLIYITGFSWTVMLLKIGKHIKKQNSIILLVSGISYEIYLVHHTLSIGKFEIIHLTDYMLLNYIILLFTSFGLALLLKKISDCVNQMFLRLKFLS